MFRAFRVVGSRKNLASVSTVTAAAAISLSSDSLKPEELSIYPEPEPELVLLYTPSPLELQIGRTRRRITQSLRGARDEVQSVVDRWIGVEHAVETRVKSIISPNEQITPGLLYTGISTLTGSIVARNRSVPVRLFLPSAFFLFSLHHFLPATTGNLRSYFGELEERYLPRLAEKHAITNAHTGMLVERVKERTKEGRERIGEGVSWGIHKAQEVTGLKLSEVLKSGKAVVGKVEGVVKKEAEEVGREAKKVVDVVVEKNVKEIENELDKKVD